MEHNNWWECFVRTPDGERHDLMWVLDSDHIFAAIGEVFYNMEQVLFDVDLESGYSPKEESK